MSLLKDAISFTGLFPEAVVCGTVMAAVCSAFGVFVVLKRIVFISIALSEAATCGLALALVYHFSPLRSPRRRRADWRWRWSTTSRRWPVRRWSRARSCSC
jgi:hypothetical protein